MHFLSVDKGLNQMSGGASLKIILQLGTYVIGFFSVIFLFYTNSFLIKRRKKELGLYNILGMEKRHIAKVLFWENLFVSFVSIIMGLLWGIALSKLMFLILLKILNFDVVMGFSISYPSLLKTALLFVAIFGLIFMNHLRQIHLSKPIELLKGGQVGEKEPKTKWLLTLTGILSLSAGYYISLNTESPLAALYMFFVAVILVMIGTYALFTAGSTALLKMLRKNKRYYYQTNHFINVSGMIYRMKQNAVGLANICILSTCILVMVSTTVSIYIGMEDVLQSMFPRNIFISADNVSKEKADMLSNNIREIAEKNYSGVKNTVHYRSKNFIALQNKNSFTDGRNKSIALNNICSVELVPLSEYNNIGNKFISLNENEVLLYTGKGELADDSMKILGNNFKIKKRLNSLSMNGIASSENTNSYFIVVRDETIIEKITGDELNGSQSELSYYYAFDTDSSADLEMKLTSEINEEMQKLSIEGRSIGLEETRGSAYSIYGGLLFLGIILGTLFVMATVLIIYYKQISEGYDDKERFKIMQKVGMSKTEIKKSISSQVLIVFFLPLVSAIIHIAFAFKVIVKLLAVLHLTNVPLFIQCTAGTIFVFAIFYAFVYILTSRVYYRIVS
jgi:putative ABC transport system permease protein